MNKIKKFALAALAAAFIFCGGAALSPAAAFASEIPEEVTQSVEELPAESENTGEIDTEPPETDNGGQTGTDGGQDSQSFVEGFIELLKDRYGADYEYYYNLIIEQWGSIENYLLQFGEENLTPEQNDVFKQVITALGETSVIWAPSLAIICLIVALIWGKKKFEGIIGKFVKGYIDKTQDDSTAIQSTQEAQNAELNRQSKALAATMKGVQALLGSADKFAEQRGEIEEAAKELSDE